MAQSSLLLSKRPRAFRRLSSEDVTQEALSTRSPIVVVPPKHLMALSDAHEVAAAMELARHELEEFSSEMSSSETPPVTKVTDKYAFAFDIDGVLIRGGRPIPEAVEAIKVLNGKNPYGIKVEHYGFAEPLMLEKIDKLFACGVGELVDLPQIVVVGDQSSGKSSVLEGLIKKPIP
ncbi:hypothetical protein LTR56_027179 [Elasticomyces elasticus]|nr:hypothetical protein LTR56_027179 [Elasticomyces elasticus]KAK4897259.1 hypothetical protein LTR49_028015 [Elasticomyces elasticus]